MSIALLQDTSKAHDLLDDLEACFWVVLYVAFHFFANDNYPKRNLFDYKNVEEVVDNDETHFKITGGTSKHSFIVGSVFTRYTWDCKPFGRLIRALAGQWREYYVARGDWVAARGPEADESQREIALSRLKALRKKLIEPAFWIKKFDKALKEPEWIPHDAVPDRFPYVSEEEYQARICMILLQGYGQ